MSISAKLLERAVTAFTTAKPTIAMSRSGRRRSFLRESDERNGGEKRACGVNGYHLPRQTVGNAEAGADLLKKASGHDFGHERDDARHGEGQQRPDGQPFRALSRGGGGCHGANPIGKSGWGNCSISPIKKSRL